MAARKLLPDPSWSLAVCLRCGYPLDGLAPDGSCPECGRDYHQGMLLLHGVPRRKAGPLWRRIVWIALALVATVFVQMMIVLAVLISIWVTVLTSAALIGAFIAMLATSRRERTGPERFLVTDAGIESFPLKASRSGIEGDIARHPWGDSDGVELRRISAVWYRLRIGRWAGHGCQVQHVVFDAGIRCPDNMAAPVKSAILASLNTARGFPPAPMPASRPDTLAP